MFYTSCIYCFTKKRFFISEFPQLHKWNFLALHQTDLNSERVTFQNYPKPNEISNKYITLKKLLKKLIKQRKRKTKIIPIPEKESECCIVKYTTTINSFKFNSKFYFANGYLAYDTLRSSEDSFKKKNSRLVLRNAVQKLHKQTEKILEKMSPFFFRLYNKHDNF